MILIAWMIIAFSLIVTGVVILQPKWFVTLVSRKYYCIKCHIDITNSDKVRTRFNQENSIAERQV